MNTDKLFDLTAKLPKRLHAPLEKGIRKLPGVQKMMESEYQTMLADMETSLHPYDDLIPPFPALPDQGLGTDEIMDMMGQVQEKETQRWSEGYASGAWRLSTRLTPVKASLFTTSSVGNPTPGSMGLPRLTALKCARSM